MRATPDVSERTAALANPAEAPPVETAPAEAPEPPSGGPPPTIPLPVRLLMKSPKGIRVLQLLIRLPERARRPVLILVPLLLLVLLIAIVVVIVQLVF